MFLKRAEYKERLLQRLLEKAEQKFLAGEFELYVEERLELSVADLDYIVGIISDSGWDLEECRLVHSDKEGRKIGVFGTLIFSPYSAGKLG